MSGILESTLVGSMYDGCSIFADESVADLCIYAFVDVKPKLF